MQSHKIRLHHDDFRPVAPSWQAAANTPFTRGIPPPIFVFGQYEHVVLLVTLKSSQLLQTSTTCQTNLPSAMRGERSTLLMGHTTKNWRNHFTILAGDFLQPVVEGWCQPDMGIWRRGDLRLKAATPHHNYYNTLIDGTDGGGGGREATQQ